MKKVVSLSLILGLSLILSNPLTAQWTHLAARVAGRIDEKMVFPSATVGYVIAGDNEIHKTTDGGRTWRTVYEGFQITGLDVCFFNDIQFLTPEIGYAVGVEALGSDYAVIKTTNGGATWTLFEYERPNDDGENRAVDFPSTAAGYTVGDFGTFFRTLNGGFSWQLITTIPQNQNLIDVDFVDISTGFVLSASSKLYRTTNSGGAWQEYNLPTAFTSIQFLTDRIGFGAAANGLYKTINAGLTWTFVGSTFEGIQTMHFFDEQNGYCIAGIDIWRTTNGGVTWLLQQLASNPANEQVTAKTFAFVDQNTAFAGVFYAGNSNIIPSVLKTTNGGGGGINFSMPITTFTCPYAPLTVAPIFSETPTQVEWLIDSVVVSNVANPSSLPLPTNSQTRWHKIRLRARFGNQNTVELERDFILEPPLLGTPQLYVQTQPCLGAPVKINISSYITQYPMQLVSDNQIIAPLRLINSSGYDVFEVPPIYAAKTYTLQIVHPCGMTSGQSITLTPLPKPDTTLPLTINSANLLCQSGNQKTITLPQSQAGAYYKLYQNDKPIGNNYFGPGQLIFPTTVFDSTTIFKVVATLYSQCPSVTMKDSFVIQVERPSAAFGANGINIPLGTPVSVKFSGQEAMSYNWFFGLNASSVVSRSIQPPTITYPTGTTEAEIRLIVTAPLGCRDTVYKKMGFYNTAGLSPYWAQESKTFYNEVEVDKNNNVVLIGIGGNWSDEVIPSKAGVTGIIKQYNTALIKYDQYGVLQWSVEAAGGLSCKSVTIDTNNNIIGAYDWATVAAFSSTDGTKPAVFYNNNLINSAVVKYTPSGKRLWVAQLIPTERASVEILETQTDSTGNIYIIGKFTTGGRGNDTLWLHSANGSSMEFRPYQSFLIKISPDGQFLWTHALTYDVHAQGLKVDGKGNAQIYGNHKSILSKYDPNGNFIWEVLPVQNFLYTLNTNSLTFDEQGNSYLLGHFAGTINLYWQPTMVNNSYLELFLVKINHITGRADWVKRSGLEGGHLRTAMIQYYKGALYISSAFNKKIVYDNTIITGISEKTGLLLKVNAADGAYQMHRVLDKKNPSSSGGDSYDAPTYSLKVTDGGIHWLGKNGYQAQFGSTLLNTQGAYFLTKIPSIDTNFIIPVELFRFHAKAVEKVNVLKWATATEINNRGYDILRAGSDLIFQKIGFVNGKNKAADYEFTDADPLSIAYYKLRQIDINGKETDSKTVSVIRTDEEDISLFPNPTNGKVYIKASKFKPDYVRVVNNLGQIVIESATDNTYEIDMSHLPNGVYSVELSSKSKKIQKRIIKN